MGLVQAELERRGVVTVSVSVMPDITRKVAPPRALLIDAPLGLALGPAFDNARQTEVLTRMLALASRSHTPLVDVM